MYPTILMKSNLVGSDCKQGKEHAALLVTFPDFCKLGNSKKQDAR